MKLKLKYTNDCQFESSDYVSFSHRAGDITNALILGSDKGGIHLQYPDGSYLLHF